MDNTRILNRLFSGNNTPEAWREFLEAYSKFILKIIWAKERDYDKAMQKYLYVCTKLHENNYSILKKFKDDYSKNPDAFLSWLKTVVKNLCIDIHRKKTGRKRFPKLLRSMSYVEKKFFELYYWKGLTLEEIDKAFSISGFSGQRSAVDILHDIEAVYLNSNRAAPDRFRKIIHQEYEENKNYGSESIDPAFIDDLKSFFSYCISNLPAKEQLVLKLRFWEDAAPLEIAEALQISPPNKVYKILKKGLNKLHKFHLNELKEKR